MSEPWLILTNRYGADTRSPTQAALDQALTELYVEDHPDMTRADYEEHGAVHLRYGVDDGPMFVLTVARVGAVTLEEWADQDFGTPLAPPRIMKSVGQDAAMRLCTLLANGAIGELRGHSWESL